MPRNARPSRPFAVVAAALAATSATPAAASGPPERIDLHWNAPAECPTADVVRAEVDRLLGPSSARPPSPIPVAAAVSRDDQGAWQVHLETPGEGTTRVREIHGASCAAIADATALILALMIDPAAVAAAPPAPVEAKAPPIEVRSSPIETPRPPVEAQRAPVPVTPTSFRVSALAGLDTASLPALAATLALRGSFVYGAQRFELGAEYRPARAGTVATRPTTGGDVDLFTGAVATCRHFGGGVFEIGPCLGFELGRLHASGFGVSSPGEGSTLWAAIDAGGVLNLRLASRLALVLRLGAAVPLLRPSFVLENVGPVFRPPAVAARGESGVELIF